MRIVRGASCLVAIIFLASYVAGCDSAPGVTDRAGIPPEVNDLEFTPDLVIFENLDENQVIGDSIAVFDVEIAATATDIDDDIDSVAFIINSPFDAFEPLAKGQLVRHGFGSRFSGSAHVEIPRGNTGLYTVIVYAVDSEVSLSNQVRGLIEYQLLGGAAPEILDVEGPEEITPPVVFSYVAVVHDDDGLGNIASVITRAPNGDKFDMHDDGVSGGDEVAGDGRYTVTFDAPAGTLPGKVQFEFQAFDRQGQASEIVVRDLTLK
jgi:hypothetical protein